MSKPVAKQIAMLLEMEFASEEIHQEFIEVFKEFINDGIAEKLPYEEQVVWFVTEWRLKGC